MQDVVRFYAENPDDERLSAGSGLLEFARSQEILLRYLPAGPCTILDVGGGTGVYTEWLGGLGHEAHLIDLAPSHVAMAKARRKGMASAGVGDARRLPWADASADAVLLLGPLYHLVEREDRVQALREARRVARPGGLVALVTYAVMEVDPEVERLVERFYWETLDGHWPPERRLVEEGYRSLPFPFEPVEAPPLALEHRWDAGQLLGYVGTWSAVQSLRRAGRGDELERFGQELRAAWGDPAAARRIRWPLSLRLGRVRPVSG